MDELEEDLFTEEIREQELRYLREVERRKQYHREYQARHTDKVQLWHKKAYEKRKNVKAQGEGGTCSCCGRKISPEHVAQGMGPICVLGLCRCRKK